MPHPSPPGFESPTRPRPSVLPVSQCFRVGFRFKMAHFQGLELEAEVVVLWSNDDSISTQNSESGDTTLE